ncbi:MULTISPECIES: hypothetical protein [Enterococcus]|jgi:hypothetical protein|uniref:Uncharacterized protein n=2 Tax=Enterococcus faecalis TaxID=1351 RepID=A0AC59HSV3_ENTFL|nr:hypothetical protein [Enterococcus faecalis]EFM67193.1 hypothetical protein HMPREF9509_01738 [Enterococcus faecalis TX0411]EHU8852726.1 hypothetical protein [Enterococcus faecalis]EHV2899318.1 hypothetical protein [Enterococcus faecalis]EKZ0040100.1 hypothetical protein [Enterococcus faecalis]EOL28505.1 hypothetical protein WO5_01484 [Enterococcus faecalis EnGen0354]
MHELIKEIERQLEMDRIEANMSAEDILYIVKGFKRPYLNENQQIVLDWLKANVEQDNASPMCAVFLLGEWQTRIGSKELRNVDIAYCGLNSKQQAQVLRAFADWIEQEETE